MTAALGLPGLESAEHLGSDGFVTTYRARDVELGRMVTIEVLPPITGSEEALLAYEQSRRALYANPRHPAILPIHELGQLSDGRPYVITLRSTRRTLADRRNEIQLSSGEVAALGATLADALAVAHQRGVLHGDVRLEHIRLTEQGDPILGAFGYDRLARTLRTARGNLVTSLTNASPEVLGGADPDAAADVWALACCLHQLLVGRPPFGLGGKPSLPEIVDSVLHQPLEDLRSSGVADDLATVLEAALQRDRSRRLVTAASLRRALRGVGRVSPEPGRPMQAAAAVADQPRRAARVPAAALGAGLSSGAPSERRRNEAPPGVADTRASEGSTVDQARARRQVVVLVGIIVVLLGILAMAIVSLVG